VRPPSQVVPSGGQASFTVSFESGAAQEHLGVLSGTQTVVQAGADAQQSLAIRTRTRDDAGGFAVDIAGAFHPFAGPPPLKLEPLALLLRARSFEPRLEPDALEQLGWECHACDPPGTHPSYTKALTFTNTAGAPLTFRAGVTGPFAVLAATASVPQPPAFEPWGDHDPAFPLAFTLPPNESVDFQLRFEPPVSEASAGEALGETLVFEGAVELRFVEAAEGASQSFPLSARLVYPMLELSLERLDFGLVHTAAPLTRTFVLTNPSAAAASWHIVPPEAPEEAAAFTVSPLQGVIPGKGVGLPRTQTIAVTFAPTYEQDFELPCAFAVRHGRGCALRIAGRGTFEEVHEGK